MSTARMLRVGIAGLPLQVGLRGTARLIQANAALERLHRASVQVPHWYVPAIGARPDAVGKGYGSALLAVGTRAADAAGVPCYGEATSEYSAALAARRGFQVVEKRKIQGYTFTAIMRPPHRGREPA
jgi:GNAT superfamily N-acetyltransferase